METAREVRAALEAHFGAARIDTTTKPSTIPLTIGSASFGECEPGRLAQYRKTKAEAADLFVTHIKDGADHMAGSHRLVWRHVPSLSVAPGPLYAFKARFYFEPI